MFVSSLYFETNHVRYHFSPHIYIILLQNYFPFHQHENASENVKLISISKGLLKHAGNCSVIRVPLVFCCTHPQTKQICYLNVFAGVFANRTDILIAIGHARFAATHPLLLLSHAFISFNYRAVLGPVCGKCYIEGRANCLWRENIYLFI